MKKLAIASIITASLFGCKATDLAKITYGEPTNKEFYFNFNYENGLVRGASLKLLQVENAFSCGTLELDYPKPVDVSVEIMHGNLERTKVSAFVPSECKLKYGFKETVSSAMNEKIGEIHRDREERRKERAIKQKKEAAEREKKEAKIAEERKKKEAAERAKYQQTAEYEIKMAATVSATAQLCADNMLYLAQFQADKIERIQINAAKKTIKSRGQKWDSNFYKTTFNNALSYMSDVMSYYGGPNNAEISQCRRLKTSLSYQ